MTVDSNQCCKDTFKICLAFYCTCRTLRTSPIGLYAKVVVTFDITLHTSSSTLSSSPSFSPFPLPPPSPPLPFPSRCLSSPSPFLALPPLVVDSKCDYPAACNAMETLLLHQDLLHTPTFHEIMSSLRSRQVAIHLGPRLSTLLSVGCPASSLHKEYSGLECTVEVVKGVEDAVNHINTYGSSHTDTIVTEDGE